jgi:hypothetical protein
MTKFTCFLGKHDWRSGVDLDEQSYEKCENCGRYRYPDSGEGKFASQVEVPVDPMLGHGHTGGQASG